MSLFKNSLGRPREKFINADDAPRAGEKPRRAEKKPRAKKQPSAAAQKPAKAEKKPRKADKTITVEPISIQSAGAAAEIALVKDDSAALEPAPGKGASAAVANNPPKRVSKKRAKLPDGAARISAAPAALPRASEPGGDGVAPEAARAPACAPAAREPYKRPPTGERLTRPLTAFDKTAREPRPEAENASPEAGEARERAMTGYLSMAIGGSRLAAECKYFKPYLASGAACAICALLLLAPLAALWRAGALCYIYEGGELEGVTVAREADPELAFSSAGVELGEADEVETVMLGSTALMSVTRAHNITVIADGKTYEHSVLGKTAREALAELGIAVGENDRISPESDAPLAEGDTVILKRVAYEYRDATETVPWETVTKLSPLIDDGETLVMDEGEQRDGVAFRSYRDVYVDGELEASEIISEVYDKYPWDLVYLEGRGDAPMSPLDGSKYTDIKIVDNAPAEYERVMENSVCTAYSFNPGTWGASGMYLVQGFVAVDTSVIPYGSLLYITSPTGNFTYGWAVAADVGEAMVAGYVDIDLFFETYRESALFGKHKMNVYVVKQLTQSELEEYIANEGMFRRRVPE